MSAIPIVSPSDLRRVTASRPAEPRVWLRTLSFAALALYGVQRWSELENAPPAWRLLGVTALAVGFATLVPLARQLLAARPAPVAHLLVAALTLGLCLAALPVAGLRWSWVIHLRVAVSARAIGDGLGSLGGVLVPYLGRGYPIRLVIVLGVAVLLFDAAAALAFGPREIGDGRRAAAALPLIALAVVPATLVPPAAPILQGLILFALLAAFVWGERLARDAVAAALGVGCAAAVLGAVAGAVIDPAHAWVDYRAWAGGTPAAVTERFDWNQTYGPLQWPQDGRIVFTVHARRPQYWTAQDLTRFDGTGWVTDAAPAPALPGPDAAVRRRYTQTVLVDIDALRTQDVIGASGTTGMPQVPGGARPGAVPGTWIADDGLGPGDVYAVATDSPTPSDGQLGLAGTDYPWSQLAPDLTLTLPTTEGSAPMRTVVFPAFHHALPAVTQAALARSPYAPALSLARGLAARSQTPAAFVAAVKADLDSGRYAYDQQTTLTRDPLLTFLFSTHTGYCQQFSGAMAMLLRMGGVPARVSTGFTSGAPETRADTYAVADLDAHAWVQAWFPRYGWVTFDPTPSSAPARGGSGTGVAPITPAVTGHGDQGAVKSLPHDRSAAAASDRGDRGRTSVSRGGGTRDGHSAAGPWPWIAAALGLLAVLGLAVAAGLRRAGRRADPMDELRRALRAGGRPLADGTTLSELEDRLLDTPGAAAYVRSLRLARYGPAGAQAPSPADRRALRQALLAQTGIRGRLRILRALPPRPGAGAAPVGARAPRPV